MRPFPGYITTRHKPRMLHRLKAKHASSAVTTRCRVWLEESSAYEALEAPDLPHCDECERMQAAAEARWGEEQKRRAASEARWHEVIGPNGETREEIVAAGSMNAWCEWLLEQARS